MLKSLNYTQIQCTECKTWFKIQPSQLFEKIECDCEAEKPKPKPKAKAKKA